MNIKYVEHFDVSVKEENKFTVKTISMFIYIAITHNLMYFHYYVIPIPTKQQKTL